MARTKQTAREALQIPNLVEAVNTRVYVKGGTKSKKAESEKRMAPIRSKTKDKNPLITPPSRPSRHDKYLLAGPLHRKRPSEVAFSIREPRDKGNESSDSSTSSSPVVSTSGSDEEE